MLYWDQRLDYKVCLKIAKSQPVDWLFSFALLGPLQDTDLLPAGSQKNILNRSQNWGFALYGCAAPLQTDGRTEMAPDPVCGRQRSAALSVET